MEIQAQTVPQILIKTLLQQTVPTVRIIHLALGQVPGVSVEVQVEVVEVVEASDVRAARKALQKQYINYKIS